MKNERGLRKSAVVLSAVHAPGLTAEAGVETWLILASGKQLVLTEAGVCVSVSFLLHSVARWLNQQRHSVFESFAKRRKKTCIDVLKYVTMLTFQCIRTQEMVFHPHLAPRLTLTLSDNLSLC